jgi:hypothetical protein
MPQTEQDLFNALVMAFTAIGKMPIGLRSADDSTPIDSGDEQRQPTADFG